MEHEMWLLTGETLISKDGLFTDGSSIIHEGRLSRQQSNKLLLKAILEVSFLWYSQYSEQTEGPRVKKQTKEQPITAFPSA